MHIQPFSIGWIRCRKNATSRFISQIVQQKHLMDYTYMVTTLLENFACGKIEKSKLILSLKEIERSEGKTMELMLCEGADILSLKQLETTLYKPETSVERQYVMNMLNLGLSLGNKIEINFPK